MFFEALATIIAAECVAAVKLSNYRDDAVNPVYSVNSGYTLAVRIKVPFRATYAYYDRRWVRIHDVDPGWTIESATLNTIRGDFVAGWDRRLGSILRSWREGGNVVSISTTGSTSVESVSTPYRSGPIYFGSEQVFFFEGGPAEGQTYRYLYFGKEPWVQIRYKRYEQGSALLGDRWLVEASYPSGAPIANNAGRLSPVMEGVNTVFPARGYYIPNFFDKTPYSQPVSDANACRKAIDAAILEYASLRNGFERTVK